jgi:DNA-binding response OmpR family regulator
MGQADKPPHVALIVEDDAEVRSFAVALIEETGFDVVEAESAQEALGFLRKRGRQVALLFAGLPAADGVGLARAVKHNWPWIRLVVTSDNEHRPDLPRGTTFMQKPWRPLDVLIEAERAVARA